VRRKRFSHGDTGARGRRLNVARGTLNERRERRSGSFQGRGISKRELGNE
jgi:DNA topoisomerase IB